MKAWAPATTANLGPGFDCLGAAVSLGLTIELGDGDPLPKKAQRAIRAVLGQESGEYTGTVDSHIPKTRGLGSSAACVAAGLLIGCKLLDREPDVEDLLRLGTPIEGHPDNLAPALFGGLVLVTPAGRALRFDATPAVRPVVLIPPWTLSTKEARKAMAGHTLSVAEAAQNVAWASTLVSMLNGSAEPSRELLLECTDDNIHQPPRRELFGKTADVVGRLRAVGIAAAVSGAGPSVLCLMLAGDPSPPTPDGWEVIDAGWSAEGARLV